MTVRRYRVNPVELAIFSIVTLIFLNSVYNLFYDRQGFHPTTLAPMAAIPTTEGRAPAATNAQAAQAFLALSVKCDEKTAQTTPATKVRLTGSLCGKDAQTKLHKTQILNTANKFSATVFSDESLGTYSTDYIPLNPGKNAIQIEFTYQSGKTVAQELTVTKE